MVIVSIGLTSGWSNAWLQSAAAQSYFRMLSAGMPSGGITSAGRTYQQQVDIFLSRYEPQGKGSGPFGDVRYWRGVRYVRVRGASNARSAARKYAEKPRPT